MKGNIFSIQRASYVDGPGIRTTVFFKGCNLRCVWCHNPESRMSESRILCFKNRCTACGHCIELCPNGAIGETHITDAAKCILCGKCVEECPEGARELSGKLLDEADVMAEILADKPYYGKNGGATFSGGECMLQTDFLICLLKQCKDAGVNTAVDTAGNVPWAWFERVEPFTDWFLYDIKAFSADVHKRFTGVSNELILENYRYLYEKCREKLIVRVPVIPGCNTDEMDLISGFLSQYPPFKAELLPYHAMGVSKALAMGEEPFDTNVPDKAEMELYRQLFREKGVNCK